MAEGSFRIELRQQEDYRFTVKFDDAHLAPLATDEPPPPGGAVYDCEGRAFEAAQAPVAA